MATGTLTGQTIANTYKALLKITGTTAGGETLHATTQKVIEDGDGNPFPFSAAQDAILMTGTSRLEFNDNGEYISGDGTNLTITSGADIILAGTAVNITADTIDLSDATKDVTLNAAVDALNFDSNTLSIDASNNRVGIGTAVPSVPLNVVSAFSSGAITTSLKLATLGGYDANAGTALEFGSDQGNYATWVIGKISAPRTGGNWGGDLVFSTNNDSGATALSERMRITATGNVGIGDTDPSEAKLSIAGVASGDIGINLVQDQAQAGLFIDHNANHNAISIDSENTTQYGIYVEADALTTGSAGYFYSDSSDTSTRNVVKITNDHASATGAVALTVRQDAAVQGVVIDQNGNNQALKIDTEATTAHAIDIDAPATTTGKVINIGDANALTTGAIASFHSDSSNNDSRNLVYIANHHASADNAVGLYIHQDGADASIELAGNGSIKFPGTQGASSDANSLDDYEEGTFTPTYVSSGASFSYTSQFGGYTKIGRMVYFDAYIVSNSASGGTAGNAVYIGGLPFTCASSKYSFGGNVTQTTQWGGDFPTHALVVEGDTTLHLHYRDASDSEGLAIRYDDMATGTSDNYVGIYGFYQI